jgi:hypothetical protein
MHDSRMRRTGVLTRPADVKQSFIESALASSPTPECILWPFETGREGYGLVSLDGERLVHRVVCRRAHGAPPDGKPNALHRCGNPSCISYWHLYWGDWRENAEDARRHGTLILGSKFKSAKLTEADINPIRRSGKSNYATGVEYGVSEAAIQAVRSGRTWKHVPWE